MSKFTLDAPTRLEEGWEVLPVKVKEGQDEDGSRSRPSVPLRLRRDEERRDGGGGGDRARRKHSNLSEEEER